MGTDAKPFTGLLQECSENLIAFNKRSLKRSDEYFRELDQLLITNHTIRS